MIGSGHEKKDSGPLGAAVVSYSELLARRAAALALEKKCGQIRILDLTALTSVTDYFVIVTADSERKAKAAAEHIVDELKKDDERPLHVEGWRRCAGSCSTMSMWWFMCSCRTNGASTISILSGRTLPSPRLHSSLRCFCFSPLCVAISGSWRDFIHYALKRLLLIIFIEKNLCSANGYCRSVLKRR